MKKLLAVALLAIGSFSSAITAQINLPVSMNGRIEVAPAGACNPQATHRIGCTDVLLHSSSVDLASFEGQVVELSGTVDGLAACPTVEVDTVAPATAGTSQLALFGPRLGRQIAYTTITPPGSVVVYLFGCSNGFLPLGPVGSLFLGVPDTVYVGAVLSIGVDLRLETIPNNQALVGVTIWSQFLYASITNGFEVRFLNPNCLTIRQ